jgi:DNA mismatch repair protein PMS2
VNTWNETRWAGMATIKAIEARSVHQIQSGQVIVDLCSVVKELVENGLDAGANSLEVRFKNYGLDSIEVQDNGAGISPANYESVALKHHTSKLSIYDDLSSLETFGFRGEALSSLCALSTFYMTTAQADEAPKGKRLDFEVSGRLKGSSVVACQKGTTATVEGLFESLPVRRKELSKNIKREYNKVLGILHAYACVSTGVRFSVKNALPKSKSMTVFTTKHNSTTRENIANVYGAKTLQALVPLNLELDFQPTLTQISRNDTHTARIKVSGHISRPVWGDGRQSPDRQMFFVNGRPCGLPQIAKVMNEVYRSFNVSQTPFIFADFQMDTNAYDVNVSPDKRTILLHNATALIEKLKESLNALFEKQDQTVPQSQVAAAKLPAFKQLSIQRSESVDSVSSDGSRKAHKTIKNGNNPLGVSGDGDDHGETNTRNLLHDHFRAQASTREETPIENAGPSESKIQKDKERRAEKVAKAVAAQEMAMEGINDYDVHDMQGGPGKTDDDSGDDEDGETPLEELDNIKVRDFNERMVEQQKPRKDSEQSALEESPAPASAGGSVHHFDQQERPNVVQSAFDRMRPQRPAAEVATITIGEQTTTRIVGSGLPSRSQKRFGSDTKSTAKPASVLQFSQSLRKFGAPGTELEQDEGTESDATNAHSPAEKDHVESESTDDEAAEQMLEPPRRSQRTIKVGDDDSDPDFVDEAEEKAEEEARVAELIRLAEESTAKPTRESQKRATKVLRSSHTRDLTVKLVAGLDFSPRAVEADAEVLHKRTSKAVGDQVKFETTDDWTTISNAETLVSGEETLSLTVVRSDFATMEIIGQFNLGFILAVRKATDKDEVDDSQGTHTNHDELFIIDQHASDEKYNFERLQSSTTVSNQRLVHPILLDLTAVEEEIVLDNLSALEKNGFIVETDTSGSVPVGQRCKLLTLPLSKEVTFDTTDLDELIYLLAESPTLNDLSTVPRPAKVRKMFAMRACRSSIMIGKTLSRRQMGDVLRHMGEIEKPWNCPHGRPTMRHLTSLEAFGGWREGEGLAGEKKQDEMGVWTKFGR